MAQRRVVDARFSPSPTLGFVANLASKTSGRCKTIIAAAQQLVRTGDYEAEDKEK